MDSLRDRWIGEWVDLSPWASYNLKLWAHTFALIRPLPDKLLLALPCPPPPLMAPLGMHIPVLCGAGSYVGFYRTLAELQVEEAAERRGEMMGLGSDQAAS